MLHSVDLQNSQDVSALKVQQKSPTHIGNTQNSYFGVSTSADSKPGAAAHFAKSMDSQNAPAATNQSLKKQNFDVGKLVHSVMQNPYKTNYKKEYISTAKREKICMPCNNTSKVMRQTGAQ